jgi:hypothetical protein
MAFIDAAKPDLTGFCKTQRCTMSKCSSRRTFPRASRVIHAVIDGRYIAFYTCKLLIYFKALGNILAKSSVEISFGIYSQFS